MNITKKTNLLLGLFVTCLILSNMIGAKIAEFQIPNIIASIMNFLFFPIIYLLKIFLETIGARTISLQFFNTISVSVGILTVPIMFLITDVIEEVHGKRKVKEFIFIGISAMLLMIIITAISVFLPTASRSIPHETYKSIFSISIRMGIASIFAFFFAQLHDMWSFEFWKRKTKGKYLWLRNNLSTIVSQLIDSTVFMFIAFYKSAPMWDAVFIISLIVPYWIFKIIFALIDTPFAYLGVWWMKKKD